MANVTRKGNPFTPSASSRGRQPPVGSARSRLPSHSRPPQRNISLAGFEGKVEILNIVPSLDTGLGAASARRFEKEAGEPRPAHDTTFPEGLDRAFYWQTLSTTGS